MWLLLQPLLHRRNPHRRLQPCRAHLDIRPRRRRPCAADLAAGLAAFLTVFGVVGAGVLAILPAARAGLADVVAVGQGGGGGEQESGGGEGSGKAFHGFLPNLDCANALIKQTG